jgi:hypothetical protein
MGHQSFFLVKTFVTDAVVIKRYLGLMHGLPAIGNGVARFFVAQHTKSGENIPNDHKTDQMTTKYTKWQ